MSNTQRSSTDIERDVERKRSEVDETINEIKDRLSPEAAVDYGMNYMRGPGGQRLMGAVRDNPLAAVLVLGGLGWLFYTASQPEEERRIARARRRDRYLVPARREDEFFERDRFARERADYDPYRAGTAGSAAGASAAAVAGGAHPASSVTRSPESGWAAGAAERDRTTTGPSAGSTVTPTSSVLGTASPAGRRSDTDSLAAGDMGATGASIGSGPSTTNRPTGGSSIGGTASSTGGTTSSSSGAAAPDSAKTKADAPGTSFRNDRTP